MQHHMTLGEQIGSFVLAIIPLVVVGLWIFMLVDWYRHTKSRRFFWLAIIIVTNVIGYLFFLRSNDRSV